MKHPVRRTKIVATLGPASGDERGVAALVAAGMDVARINFSHGDDAEHRALIAAARSAAASQGKPLGILMDLPGPKLRLGDLPAPVELSEGADVGLGPGGDLPVNFPELVGALRGGQQVLLDDGALSLVVIAEAPEGGPARLRVVDGGTVTSRKGVNLPDTALPIGAVTPEDEAHLRVGLEAGVDFVALSFVRSGDDVRRLKELVAEQGGGQQIVAKIEKKEALAALDDILTVADAVMVARGDLGVEVPAAEVPIWQKRIITAAVRAGKPVITATQMLQSMITEPRPTRAEASDVANAIFDSTTAVMLSGETAMGRYPVESVATMARIAETAEAEIEREGRAPQAWALEPDSVTGAISFGACDVARKIGAAAIVTATSSGATARHVAHFRPPLPIVAVSPNELTVRQLTLAWGVTPLTGSAATGGSGAVVEDAVRQTVAAGFVGPGDRVVVTAGVRSNAPGATDLIQAVEL